MLARFPLRTLAHLSAWIVLATIVAATLSPIAYRPQSPLPVTFERELAFFLAAFGFTIGTRRSPLLVLALLIGCAGALELGQTLTATRHGEFGDFAFKSLGVSFGVAAGVLCNCALAFVKHRWPGRAD